jgi:hypothetical protein
VKKKRKNTKKKKQWRKWHGRSDEIEGDTEKMERKKI